MNYYERHLGDYAKDTAHLSMLEHGAYTLLLDRYYSTEAGIPEDQAHRVARARSKDERAAVDAVLAEFFTLRDGVWINGRAEEEIPKAQARINSAQVNGKKGGRPRKNQNETQQKPSGLSVGSENETQSKAHHAPDTKHQTNTGADAPAAQACATPGAAVTLALKAHGIGGVGPSHPRLTALLAAGATVEEFTAFAAKALDVAPARAFEYVLGCVEGERQRAKDTAAKLHRGPMPVAQSKQAALEARNAAVVAKLSEQANAA